MGTGKHTFVFSSIFSPRPCSARTANETLRLEIVRAGRNAALVLPGRRKAVEVIDRAMFGVVDGQSIRLVNTQVLVSFVRSINSGSDSGKHITGVPLLASQEAAKNCFWAGHIQLPSKGAHHAWCCSTWPQYLSLLHAPTICILLHIICNKFEGRSSFRQPMIVRGKVCGKACVRLTQEA